MKRRNQMKLLTAALAVEMILTPFTADLHPVFAQEPEIISEEGEGEDLGSAENTENWENTLEDPGASWDISLEWDEVIVPDKTETDPAGETSGSEETTVEEEPGENPEIAIPETEESGAEENAEKNEEEAEPQPETELFPENENETENNETMQLTLKTEENGFDPELMVCASAGQASSRDMADRAGAYLYRTADSVGISTSSNWCVRFVKRVAADIGLSIGSRECVGEFCRDAIDTDNGHFYAIDRSTDVDLRDASHNITDVSRDTFTPKRGDLICFLWYDASCYNGNYDHIGIVTDVSGDALTYIDGNSSAGNYTTIVSHTVNWRNYGYICGYLRPRYSDANTYPIGWFDTAEGLDGKVRVKGWAYDPDDPSAALSVHVYVGGPTNSGAPSFAITADKERRDVDDYYGCGRYHGFDEEIPVDARGVQQIYVYAIDAGPNPEYNPEIQNCPLTADIQDPEPDFIPPVMKAKTFRRREARNVKNWLIGAEQYTPTRFTSSDNNVLKINESTGRVQILNSGSAEITVFFGENKVSRVYNVKLPGITNNAAVAPGERKVLRIENHQDGNVYRVKSSNKEIVKTCVYDNGDLVIKGMQKGTATVTLYVDDVSYGKCTVTVR
ncbi:MAG: CHAP domain-containing protein [Lachnospiraceae bacterium]|nr:CHAP domain-containing protein [Lachnospiraceae bacterium]